MKILQIRFKNLNSLVGEWSIDLTHAAFAADGIFAITGPTGSGKSTILDAICLALYGRTPRLNKVTKSGNEIMSRQTGDCFAEVTFETAKGRFRCHWSQRKARLKSDGELQAPKHEITDADTGRVLEEKIKGVAEQIEAETGMDFDRFTRSMLLAQGDFAKFLQAAVDERAPILEQITGTDIYTQISVRVHELQREQREKLHLLGAETKAITLLAPEEEKEMGQSLATQQKQAEALDVQYDGTKKAMAWLDAVDQLKKDIGNLANDADKLRVDVESFKPEQEKLSRAVRAASLDGVYATLTSTRKQQSEDRATLNTEEEALPGLESAAKEQAEVLKATVQRAAKAKAELKAGAPILKQVRSLDQTLSDLGKAIAESEEACGKDAAALEAKKKDHREAEEGRAGIGKELALVEVYLKDHARDEWLVSGLAGVEGQLNDLVSRQEDLRHREAERDNASKVLDKAVKTHTACLEKVRLRTQELKEMSGRLQQSGEALSRLLGGRLLRECRAEKDHLLKERAFLSRIAELESHRHKLEDGKPCPLCGATEHPYAIGNVPVPDEVDRKIEDLSQLITKAEEQESAIKVLKDDEESARKTLAEAEKLEVAAVGEKGAAEKALGEAEQRLAKLQAEFAERKQAAAATLLPLGVTSIPEADITALLEDLQARMESWQKQSKEKSGIEKQIVEWDNKVKVLGVAIESETRSLAEKSKRLEKLKKDHTSKAAERSALYGDKVPDDEEHRMSEEVAEAEGAEKQARERHDELQRKWTSAKDRVASLKKNIDKRQPEQARQEAEFSRAVETAGFADEEQFLAARLTSDQRSELEAAARRLNERQTDLAARRKDRSDRLTREEKRKVTDKTREELTPLLKEQGEVLNRLRDSIANLKSKLQNNVTAKDQIKEKQAAIEAQKKECERWDTLHALIGASDGKKYRNFVQGLTFEIMIGHANRQLRKMSDRYLLRADENSPLELNVMDNYQAGEVRSTKNLSGGESFIVSLALALGLSHMSSRKVRVDSLFLDEGFGTLDPDALDTALDTLAGLQQDGKIIGIISHVQALKDRITTQIQVEPGPGGKSSLSGPGCGKSNALSA